MTWKSYAVVSGASVLAGWLASSPPSTAPVSAPVNPAPGAATGTSGPSEIELEAARLQARVRQEVEYQRPERNPFRFGASRSVATRVTAIEPPASEPAVMAPSVPVAPPVTLSGIAEDQVGERTERTAILSSASGVLLVREGDQVLGQYRVGRIETGAVELVNIADGATTRLTLR